MANFDLVIDKLIEDEGGYVDHPADPGGETKYGISKRAYPHLDIKGLSKEEARAIYFKDYWEFFRLEEIRNQNLADKVFNLGVTMGMGTSIKLLQRSYRSVRDDSLKDDGILGSQTISKINAIMDTESNNGIICAFKAHCDEYYRSLRNKDMIAGWLNRVYS